MTLVVVLDIDDTLYLERDYVRSGFAAVGQHVAERLGREGFAERAWARFEAGDRGRIFDEVLADVGAEMTPSLVPELVAVYRGHIPAISLLPDAGPFLASVVDHGALAVLTDGDPVSQRAKVAALGLDAVAAPVVVTDELGGPAFRKPHAAGFDAIQRHHGPPDEVDFVYLADNPGKDLEGARHAGWRFVRVRRPGGLHHGIDAPAGTVEVTGLDEVLAVLGLA